MKVSVLNKKVILALASLWGASAFLSACATESNLQRENAGIRLAGAPNEINLVFVSAPRCRTQPFGCGLGGQLGGMDAQKKLLQERKSIAETMAFWGGTTFFCDGGANSARASGMAEFLREMPITFLAPSGEDLKIPLKELRRLKAISEKPWVVSNYVAKDKDLPWVPYLDVKLAQGQFRIFNFAWPLKKNTGRVHRGLSPDLKNIQKMLGETPPDRVNVVLVSTLSSDWFYSIVDFKKAHIILDSQEMREETGSTILLPSDRIIGSVRPRGQAAMVYSIKTEPTFTGFYSEPIASFVRFERQLGKKPSEDNLSVVKVPGLWEITGELALLASP